jgi:hypothetical protein
MLYIFCTISKCNSVTLTVVILCFLEHHHLMGLSPGIVIHVLAAVAVLLDILYGVKANTLYEGHVCPFLYVCL